MPQYRFEDWQLLAGVLLGWFAAVVVTVLALFMALATRLLGQIPDVARSTLGGVLFGVVGIALPLTLFTGSAQLKTVLSDASTLGAGLLAVIVIAKIFTFAVSQESGFIGGPNPAAAPPLLRPQRGGNLRHRSRLARVELIVGRGHRQLPGLLMDRPQARPHQFR